MEVTSLGPPALFWKPVVGGAAPRSPGLHLTDVLNYLDDQVFQRQPRESWPHAAIVGWAWEDVIGAALGERMTGRWLRGFEVERDGVFMTPDALDLEAWEIWEFKATWRSTRTLPHEVWRWMAQVKAYCYALGASTVNMGVLYLNGDGGGNRQPQPVGVRLRFSDSELEDNWTMVRNAALVLGRAKEAGDGRHV